MDERSQAIDAVASYFGVLSEPTRIRIMHAICEEEKTVSKIVEELGASQTNVSRHLGIMHRSGVLSGARNESGLLPHGGRGHGGPLPQGVQTNLGAHARKDAAAQ